MSQSLPETTVSTSPSEAEKLRALPWSYAFGMLNALFAIWTFGGSMFVLFLNEVGLTKAQIGGLLSLFPFCGVVALVAAPTVARLGRKRTFLACYGLRNLVMASLVLLPLVIAHLSQTAAVRYVFLTIMVFALLRALAETGYYPWSQEYVPNRVRGTYTALQAVLGTVAAGFAVALSSYVIRTGTGMTPYLLLLSAGCAAGLLSVGMATRIPGGAPILETTATREHVANLWRALRDPNFASYLAGLGTFTMGTAMMVSFLPLYLTEQLMLAPGSVVRFDIAVMVGGALSSLLWGRLADRVGSRPVLMPALLLSLMIPLGWLLLPRNTPHLTLWCAALYFTYGVASNGVALGATRLLFNGVVPPARSTSYTAVYYAWAGVAGGIAPLLAGSLLAACRNRRLELAGLTLDGHSLLFALAFTLSSLGWWLYSRVRPDDAHTTRQVVARAVGRLGAWTATRKGILPDP